MEGAIQIRTHPLPLGVLLLILHGPHLLLGLMHLNTIPNLPINHFSHMLPPHPQWNTPSQQWRPPFNQSLALIPPPPS